MKSYYIELETQNNWEEADYFYQMEQERKELEKLCKTKHSIKTYQAEEKDTNVPESLTCDECGKEFDIPDPHDAQLQEAKLELELLIQKAIVGLIIGYTLYMGIKMRDK